MAVEVGMGYVSIVPEVEGFASQLQRAVTGPAADAGQEAGGAAGEGFTGKMGGFLKGSLVGVGLAAGAVLVKGLMDAIDQTAINGKIQATLGSTEAEAARYGKAAGQLYAHGVTDSVDEAASAIGGIMRSGILPPEATNAQIEAITGKVANLSKVFELDLGQTSNAVGQMLKNGLAKDGSEALDILTVGMQKMGPRADDMADTFNEYSTKFRDLGLSAADAMGLMSQGMLAGARDTDTVADALKEFQIRATDGSDASKEAYEAIGLNAKQMTDQIAAGGAGAKAGLQQVLEGLKGMKNPAEQNAAAVGLFGTKAEDLGQALWALDTKTAVKGLGDVGGAADKMGDALHNNASARITQFKRTAEVAMTNFIGDKVLPSLIQFAGVARDTLGPALGTAKNIVGGFLGAFTSGEGAASIGGYVTGLASMGATLRDTLMPAAQRVGETFTSQVLPPLRGLGMVVMNGLLPALMALHSTVAGAVMPVLSTIASIVMDTVVPALMNIYAAVYENLQPIFAEVSNFIRERVVPVVEMLGVKLREFVTKCEPVISVVSALISWFGRFAADVLGTVIPILIRLIGPVFSNMFKMIGTAIDWVGNIIQWIGKFAQALGRAVTAVTDFSAKARSKFGDFVSWLKGFPGQINKAMGDFRRLLVSKGQDLARGIWEGIKSMGGWLSSQLTNWAKSVIPGPIAKALDINSPSRLMRDMIGRMIPRGIMVGVDLEQDALDARLKAMVTAKSVQIPNVKVPVHGAAWDRRMDQLAEALAEMKLDAQRGDIVVAVDAREIARATATGQRQLTRR